MRLTAVAETGHGKSLGHFTQAVNGPSTTLHEPQTATPSLLFKIR